ncbi:DUF2659 family protein [Aestuariispira ectoiniformans]|uniref:DUF2659 family protein n=1 Tax=Aestuariispira ectoiniformans TaxID=2775080 RepID=UPI00223A730B|nr:tetratricopeptide repeat protein [Aestuariispira ectoiniformans]
MSDIFDEIEEDLKRDRLEEAWKKYGKYVIAVAVVIVLATAGNTAWRHYQASQKAEMANRFDEAGDLARNGDVKGAIDQLSAMAKDGGGYGTLARLQQASLMAENGDNEGAVAVYDAVAADSSIDPIYSELALVLAVMHQLDSGDPQTLLDRLASQLKPEAPWRFTAYEMAAGLSIRKGDKEAAADYLKKITDDAEAPQAARQRASELLQAVGA